MTIKTAFLATAAAVLVSASVAPATGLASDQGRNTLLGGLAGAGAGAALTHGSVGGALVGAAGGALIGNAVSRHHHHYHHRWREERRYGH